MRPPGFPEPVSIYINWASYDLLSDTVPLTEELAMQQLEHLLRLKRAGVRMDYYLMDAFWFDPEGAYRTWDRRYWTAEGPDRWIKRCHEHHVLPGLWVGSNALATPIFRHLAVAPAWQDSMNATGEGACMFHGGFLNDFIAALQHWTDRGVRLFKFDFADLNAAPREIQQVCLPSEIHRRNAEALRAALALFRGNNPAVRLIAYNGLAEDGKILAGTSAPIRRSIDTAWLDVFDTVYCGDPRPADVPCASFWRSKDIYSDHMVRYFEANGYPLSRIDNAGFMIGTTGTCYGRSKQAWRGMLVLSLARGGWANTYYGNLDLLTDEDAHWFAAAQGLFLELQRSARLSTFGGIPGEAVPYGFWAHHGNGDVMTVVNPASTPQTLALPSAGERVLFRDSGFAPRLSGQSILLGPEQLAVVASGRFAQSEFELGVESDVIIPQRVSRVAAEFSGQTATRIRTSLTPPAREGRLRVIVRQTRGGVALRSSGGPPPQGTTLGQMLQIVAAQSGRKVPVATNYDLAIWSGLSWAVGEIELAHLSSEALEIECSTTEAPPLELAAELLHVG